MRGSGIYGGASLLNHECLPNTARCDSFDARTLSGRPGDTSLRFVALHDIPAGEELIASYFPLTCTYKERQQRCRDVYGFECRCARCQVRHSRHGCHHDLHFLDLMPFSPPACEPCYGLHCQNHLHAQATA